MKTKLMRLFSLAVFIFAVIGCATTPAVKSAGIPLENDPAIVSGVLENGLSYRIVQNKYPENRIFLRLVVKAGSILEAANEQGLAHFVEHMAFNGSTHFSGNELISYFESIGMNFGADVNASTFRDKTVYMLEIPADNPDALAMSLTVISDWTSGITFDDEELEKERGVVIEEWRSHRGVDERAWDALLPFLFPLSRYSNRSPIGKPAVIRNAPRERVVNFYKRWYRPELMTVVIVGDADSRLLEKEVRERLASIPPSEKPIKRPEYGVSNPKIKLNLLLSDPETPYTQVFIGSLFPTLTAKTIGDYRMITAMTIALSSFNARLREQVEESGAFSNASSYPMQILDSMSAGIVWFNPRKGKFTEAFQSALDEIDRFAQFGVTETEMERQKANLRRSALDAWQKRETIESGTLISRLVESVLNNTPVLSPQSEYQLALDTINSLTVDDVNTAIKTYYAGRGTRLVVSTSPDAGLPSKGRITSMWKNYRNRSLTPYQDILDNRPLFPPELAGQSGAVIAERTLSPGSTDEPRITEFTLSNGAKVVVCPTDFKKDSFVFNAVSRGGLSLISDDAYPSAMYSAYYAETSGLNGFKQTEVAKKLAGTVLSVSRTLNQTSAGLQGTGAAQDMETFFQLVNMNFTAPNFTEAAWERIQSDILANSESRQKYPNWRMSDEMQKFVYRDSIRFTQSTAQFLDLMDRAQAEDYYRQFYRNAGNFTFIFTGDITVDEVKRLSAIYLASLPTTGEKTEAQSFYPPFPEGKQVVTVKKGIEQQGTVRIYFGGDNSEIEGDVLTERELVSAMVSLVEMHLRKQIREKLGAVYGFSIYCEQQNYPTRRYNAQIAFGCDPKRAEELAGLVIEELRAMAATPASDTELTKLKEAFIRKRETDRKTNDFWQGVLTANYRRGAENAQYSNAEKVLTSLNAETMRRLIGRYFKSGNYVTGYMLPED